jgi:uncharacterized membrane protein YccF (DUF307 family)
MRYVVHEHYAHGATVIAGCDCVEALLAGRVPAVAEMHTCPFSTSTYHICNLIFLPFNSMVLILKSMPIKQQEVSDGRCF